MIICPYIWVAVKKIPCFIDFEASSLRAQSYPIAVAWSLPNGHIRRFLISPAQVADWDDWSVESESIHGIDQQRLLQNGWPPDYVYEELYHDLKDETLWADAPDFDNHWLNRLAQAAGCASLWDIHHTENLFSDSLRKADELEWQAAARLSRLIDDLAPYRHNRHDAGADVGWLIRLWQVANGMPFQPNHAIGPLPPLPDFEPPPEEETYP